MSDPLTDRLNKVLPRLVSDDLLGGSGIGNETAFYIFDYPPEDELRVRDHIRFVLDHISKQKPGIKVKHVNLFDFVLDILKKRNFFDKAIQMQRDKGDESLKKALAGPLHPEKLAPVFVEVARPSEHDLVLVSGVGSVYPLLRTSGLLNNLQPVMGRDCYACPVLCPPWLCLSLSLCPLSLPVLHVLQLWATRQLADSGFRATRAPL
jgi:Domain of unknown function (DUF1788)